MPYKNSDKEREDLRLAAARWRQRHPDHAQQVQRDFYQRHKERIKKRRRDKYALNRVEEVRKASLWRERHPEKTKEIQRNFYQKNRERMIERAKKNQEKRPDQMKAHQAIHIATRSGRMIPPTHCSTCGKKRKVQAHHHLGYSQEHWFSVIWLCASCHTTTHNVST